ncbi:Putative non-heme bromoperoxidase BpoC [Ruegeria sp. THAF57]|uniref:alpha/beta fold hydrolase n=1 Tax=Ruegeria sp. THAF57 TaxID=2744555 RepID=UPI0015DE27C0|nr:alpha/beta hydrolase [Ruegeria sp. THAF57]CAD0183183.1 Putative non-heme bromoperoxidase BpoC [Ruegeria sp. THAF57]
MTWTTRPRSESGDLAAIEAGEGPLVILLHGVGLRAEAWNAQIDAFGAAGFRVVCPDMSGHGRSPFRDPDGLLSYVKAVEPLLSEPSVLVGHSMGALIALSLAASGHEHFRGVAALNAVYRRDPKAREAVIARATSLSADVSNDPSGTLRRWFGDQETKEREACAQWLTEVNPAAYKAAYSVFAESDGVSDEDLSKITCPALFMTGADEPNSTPTMSRKMADLVAQGRAEIVPGAAHMMPMTHPVQVNSFLLGFVQECLI